MGVDLASSTEKHLCDHLTELDCQVTLISPGELDSQDFHHIPIHDWRIPGLTTISGARNACSIIEKNGMDDYDIVLIDWRYVKSMSRAISRFKIPWAIVDRGPPAKLGFFNRLQKWYWAEAWNFANTSSVGGTVVSTKHRDFVHGLTGYSKQLFVVPAGSNNNPYLEHKKNPHDLIKLVYIGRIDRRRGVSEIINLSEKLNRKELKYEINICGSGDFEREIREASDSKPGLIFHGEVSNDEVLKIMGKCHLGIMPMPDIPVWRISSTLKLAEYLSSGLGIIGADHPGNRIPDMGGCNMLSKGDWVTESLSLLGDIHSIDWPGILESSLVASETVSWRTISKNLRDVLENWIKST